MRGRDETIGNAVEGLPLRQPRVCPDCYLVTWMDDGGFQTRQGVPMKKGQPSEGWAGKPNGGLYASYETPVRSGAPVAIPDMGDSPFLRSGDFVLNLGHESKDRNEYPFAPWRPLHKLGKYRR